jgi:hypothetical protein
MVVLAPYHGRHVPVTHRVYPQGKISISPPPPSQLSIPIRKAESLWDVGHSGDHGIKLERVYLWKGWGDLLPEIPSGVRFSPLLENFLVKFVFVYLGPMDSRHSDQRRRAGTAAVVPRGLSNILLIWLTSAGVRARRLTCHGADY